MNDQSDRLFIWTSIIVSFAVSTLLIRNFEYYWFYLAAAGISTSGVSIFLRWIWRELRPESKSWFSFFAVMLSFWLVVWFWYIDDFISDYWPLVLANSLSCAALCSIFYWRGFGSPVGVHILFLSYSRWRSLVSCLPLQSSSATILLRVLDYSLSLPKRWLLRECLREFGGAFLGSLFNGGRGGPPRGKPDSRRQPTRYPSIVVEEQTRMKPVNFLLLPVIGRKPLRHQNRDSMVRERFAVG
jgi:hypothetical protein